MGRVARNGMEENWGRGRGPPGNCRDCVAGSCPDVEALLSLQSPLLAEGRDWYYKGQKRWLAEPVLLSLSIVPE